MTIVSKEEWEKTIEEGSEAMVQALKTFGPSETLNLLLYFSNNDPVLNQLLIKYPSIVAVGEFFSRMLVYKNRDDKVKEINVKRGCDDKSNINNEGPSTLEDAFKCPILKKILNSDA